MNETCNWKAAVSHKRGTHKCTVFPKILLCGSSVNKVMLIQLRDMVCDEKMRKKTTSNDHKSQDRILADCGVCRHTREKREATFSQCLSSNYGFLRNIFGNVFN
jgi:hypothetical protein